MKHAAVLAQVYGRFLDVSALPVKGRIRDMLISRKRAATNMASRP